MQVVLLERIELQVVELGRATVELRDSGLLLPRVPIAVGAALAFESEAYRGRRERLLGLLESLPTLGPVERMEAADELGNKEEGDPEGSLLTLRALLRDVAELRLAPSLVPLNADVADRLLVLARGPLGERAPRLAESVAETREALSRNANRPLAFDLLLDALAS